MYPEPGAASRAETEQAATTTSAEEAAPGPAAGERASAADGPASNKSAEDEPAHDRDEDRAESPSEQSCREKDAAAQGGSHAPRQTPVGNGDFPAIAEAAGCTASEAHLSPTTSPLSTIASGLPSTSSLSDISPAVSSEELPDDEPLGQRFDLRKGQLGDVNAGADLYSGDLSDLTSLDTDSDSDSNTPQSVAPSTPPSRPRSTRSPTHKRGRPFTRRSVEESSVRGRPKALLTPLDIQQRLPPKDAAAHAAVLSRKQQHHNSMDEGQVDGAGNSTPVKAGHISPDPSSPAQGLEYDDAASSGSANDEEDVVRILLWGMADAQEELSAASPVSSGF